MDFLGTLVKLAPPFFFAAFSGALINAWGDMVFQGTFLDQNFNFTGVLLKVDKVEGVKYEYLNVVQETDYQGTTVNRRRTTNQTKHKSGALYLI